MRVHPSSSRKQLRSHGHRKGHFEFSDSLNHQIREQDEEEEERGECLPSHPHTLTPSLISTLPIHTRPIVSSSWDWLLSYFFLPRLQRLQGLVIWSVSRSYPTWHSIIIWVSTSSSLYSETLLYRLGLLKSGHPILLLP